MSEAASLQELIRALVFKLIPSLVLTGVHSYTVAKDNGDGRFDLQPAPRVLHGPRLRVEQGAAPGIEGGLKVDDKVLVVFVDHDEEQPMVIGHLPLRDGKPASLKIDATGTIRIGAGASLVHIGSGTDAMIIGAEVLGRRAICYGDNVQIPVVGAVAVGPIIQNPATAPNQISKVRI